MFILKNAWISIIRNKGRNVLIGVIILIVACTSTITLAIKNTASDLIDSYANAYEKEVTISFDRSNMMKDFDMSKEESREEAKKAFEKISSYTVDDVKSYAESSHIEDYHYTYTIALNGNSIEKAESEVDDKFPNMGGGRGGSSNQSNNSMDFTLNGYSSVSSMSEFINGTYTITDITDDAWDVAFTGNYVFINEELATYNELKLNDKIILEDETGTIYEFEIIGIYTENSSSESSLMSMFSNSVNTIVTNADALVNITSENDSVNGTVTPTFIIDSYDNVQEVQEEFYEKGLDETYVLETNEETAMNAVSGVSNVNSFATTFLVITLIIGGTVLFVINMINIRERKYEIGVLRTIGISKFKLTMQFVSELLIVAFVALLLGAGIGAMMSKNVSNSLLANEIENSSERVEEIQNNFGGKGNGGMEVSGRGNSGKGNINMNKVMGKPTVQAYDSIDAVVDITVIVELLVIGLSLVLISSLAAMISIQRFSPLTILKERS